MTQPGRECAGPARGAASVLEGPGSIRGPAWAEAPPHWVEGEFVNRRAFSGTRQASRMGRIALKMRYLILQGKSIKWVREDENF